MEKKKNNKLSIAALVTSILPLLTFAVGRIFQIPVSAVVQRGWTGANIMFIVIGLVLSFICVRDRASRNVLNIIAMGVNVFWLLLVVGIVGMAIVLNIIS